MSKNKTGFLDFDDCFRGYAVVLVGVASALLYYQITKIWFQLMGTTGKNGMKEAGQAMDNANAAGDKVGSQTRSPRSIK